MSRQGLAQNDQKCQLCAKFGSFGANNSNFTGKSKSFGTNITEKTPRHLVCIVCFVGMGRNDNIWPKMTKNAYFGQNLTVLGPT